MKIYLLFYLSCTVLLSQPSYCFALQHKKHCIIKLMAIVYRLLCENPSPQITFE